MFVCIHIVLYIHTAWSTLELEIKSTGFNHICTVFPYVFKTVWSFDLISFFFFFKVHLKQNNAFTYPMENMIAVKSMTMLNSLDLTMSKANKAVTGLGVGSYSWAAPLARREGSRW